MSIVLTKKDTIDIAYTVQKMCQDIKCTDCPFSHQLICDFFVNGRGVPYTWDLDDEDTGL